MGLIVAAYIEDLVCLFGCLHIRIAGCTAVPALALRLLRFLMLFALFRFLFAGTTAAAAVTVRIRGRIPLLRFAFAEFFRLFAVPALVVDNVTLLRRTEMRMKYAN